MANKTVKAAPVKNSMRNRKPALSSRSIPPHISTGVAPGCEKSTPSPAIITRPAAVTQGLGAPTSILATGNTTLTIAQLLTGMITYDCGGGARTAFR